MDDGLALPAPQRFRQRQAAEAAVLGVPENKSRDGIQSSKDVAHISDIDAREGGEDRRVPVCARNSELEQLTVFASLLQLLSRPSPSSLQFLAGNDQSLTNPASLDGFGPLRHLGVQLASRHSPERADRHARLQSSGFYEQLWKIMPASKGLPPGLRQP